MKVSGEFGERYPQQASMMLAPREHRPTLLFIPLRAATLGLISALRMTS